MLKDLARAPRIGSLKHYESPGLSDVRSWWVRGFRNHLVFYFATDDGIDVLAVAHGARKTSSVSCKTASEIRSRVRGRARAGWGHAS